MKLSVVIPAQNEADSIGDTVDGLVAALERPPVDYEVVVVDDGSADGTREIVETRALENARIHCIASPYPPGFGLAVRAGLESMTGDAVAVMMADGSDSPEDLLAYRRLLLEGYDCAFG